MYELTTQQQNIWNLQSYYEDTSISNISGILHFKERLDTDILKKAINLYVKYQEGARLRFVKGGSRVRQYVAEYEPFEIPVKQFVNLSDMHIFADEEAKIPYHFGENKEASEWMYHFTIYETTKACGIIIHMNHLISDAWTLSLFCGTVIEYYRMFMKGINAELQFFRYIDYIQKEKIYLESDRFQKDTTYWRNRFTEAPVRKQIKPEIKEAVGISSIRLTEKIMGELSERIRKFCVKHSFSPAIIFESVIFTYLSKINNSKKETIIGVPVLNRTGKDKNVAGMFISTMPLGIMVEPEDTMLKVCQKVSVSHFELFRHQKFPYRSILKHIRQMYGFEGNLYDVMVSYQNAVVVETDEMEYETEWLSNGYSEVPMSFHIDDRDKRGGFTINMDVQEEVFSKEEAQWLLKRILYMVDTVTQNEQMTVEQMPIMSQEEYKLVLHQFNDTKMDYPKDKCYHEIFKSVAMKNKDATALVFNEKRISYKELDETSDAVAFRLVQEGVKSEEIVAVIMKRDWRYVSAILGIMKVGAAFMPIDPQYPIDRINYMLDEAKSNIALLFGFTGAIICKKVLIDEIDYSYIDFEIDNSISPENICYVIFTSGSTGKPKGTLIKHNGLVNFILSESDYHNYCKYNINSVLAIATFTFDITVDEILKSLLYGKCIVIADEMAITNVERLSDIIINNKVECLIMTPSRLKYYLGFNVFQKAFKQVHCVLCGGEEFTESLYNKISIVSSKIKIFNGYGPTEATCGCSYEEIVYHKKITIGKPISNTQFYIVNHNVELCPIGVAGELWIAGVGVAKGYLNRPKLTSEKFIENLFLKENRSHGKTVYKTGDLVRWNNSGCVEYLGRIDNQIKMRGLRIELGEIENQMCLFEGIQQTIVADKNDLSGKKYLVGYYIVKRDMKQRGGIDEKRLQKYLLSKLPRYMVPTCFMELEKIVTNANGKLERKSLPSPKLKKKTVKYAEPVTDTQRKLCIAMGKVLNKKIGIDENFFDEGGDSLDALAFCAEAGKAGLDFSAQILYEHPTIKELSEYIEGKNNIGSNSVEKDNIYLKQYESKYEKFQAFLRAYPKAQKSMQTLRNVSKTISGQTASTDHIITESHKTGIILTGVTGFLGAHILQELLESDENKRELYCLVRGKEEESAKLRLCHVMETYFDCTVSELVNSKRRVHVIACDITENPIACITKVLQQYPSKVTQVIHIAALVKHYGEYETFYNVNVEGTKHMLAVANAFDAEFLHVSTESVGGLYIEENSSAKTSDNTTKIERIDPSDKIRAFSEQDFYIGQNLDNVYIRSKFEAESCVLEYILTGGRARIFRVGNLTNRYSDGRFQKNYAENAFLRRMHTFLSLGVYPDVLEQVSLEFSPIDETARAIITLAFCEEDLKQCIYHVSHSCPITYGQLADQLTAIGTGMCALPVQEFVSLLKAGTVSHDYVKNDLNEIKKRIAYTPVVSVNAQTSAQLKKLGFTWHKIDEKYLKQYVAYVETLKM